MARKKRKPKQPFWKKLDPELRHIGEHLGKVIDNSTIKDVADIALMLSVGYLGFSRASQPEEAVTAMLGYKLATSEGGSPPVSQIVGCGLLGYQFIGLPYAAQQAQVLQEATEISEAPMHEKPFYTEWVMASITGSTHLMYCAWVKSFHGITPKICQSP